MKKSILFGVLAFFAVNAMSIQSIEAQNPVKKSTTEKKVEKKTETTAVSAESNDVKKDDCCANKNVAADKKAGDCCAADKKVAADGQKVKRHEGLKPHHKKGHKTEKANRSVKTVK